MKGFQIGAIQALQRILNVNETETEKLSALTMEGMDAWKRKPRSGKRPGSRKLTL